MGVSLCQLRCANGPVHPQDKEPRLWEFPPSLVFRRMDSFLHRLKTIEVTAQHRAWGWGRQGRQGANTAPAARGTQQHGGAPGWAGPGVDAFGNIGSRGTAQPWCCSLGTSSAREWGAGAGHAAEPDLEAVGAHQELYEISIEFLKLEKAEMGGARGNILGSQVFQIYEEVSELVRGFADCKYDPLDPAEEVSECWYIMYAFAK